MVASDTNAGYSGTPLAKKLGLKEGMSALVINEPQPYSSFFSDLPEPIFFVNRSETNIDFIHLFCQTFQQLEKNAPLLIPKLKKNGLMWVSWPKGSSKLETDMKREPLRSFVLKLGLVDVKVCAVDKDWSGLKFVYRVKDR